MNNTAPIWMGVAAIAGLVFVIATGVSFVLWDLGYNGSVFVGVVVSAIAAIALSVGWAPPIDDTPAVKTQHNPAPTPAAVVAPAAPAEPVSADPVMAPAPGEAGKPVFLTAARADGPDDLKLIKGVGPKLETMLHDMGVFHFDQIAAWGPAEEAWMDDNLEGFRGRVSRDEWVAQAKTLAAGGTA